MAVKRMFNVALEPELHIFLKTFAAKKHKPMSDIIEDCIRRLKKENNRKYLQSKNTSV